MDNADSAIIEKTNDLVRNGKKIQAYQILKQYISDNAASKEIYLTIGQIAKDINTSEAIHYYKEGITLCPDDNKLNIALGFLYFNNKEYHRAEKYLLKIWVEDPTNTRILTTLGKIYKSFKQFEKAMKYFKLCELLEPDNSFALYGIADTYRGIGDNKTALKYWLKFNKIEPNNKLAITRIGDCYARLNEKENALQFYRKALEIGYDFFAHLGLAKIHLLKNDRQKAVEIFEKIFQAEQKNSRFFYEYISLCLSIGLNNKALELYNMACNLFPGNTHLKSLASRLSKNP